MDSKGPIHSLARSGLSTPLTRQIVQWCDTDPARAALGARASSWVEHVGNTSWQAFARHRATLHRSAKKRGQSRPRVSAKRVAFIPGDRFARDYVEAILLRAIVAASVRGGQLDRAGIERVLLRLCADQLSADHRSMLVSEIRKPVSIRRLARFGADMPTATMIYVVSAMALDTAEASATLYLTALADALGLDASLVAQVHPRIERQPGPGEQRILAQRRQRAVAH